MEIYKLENYTPPQLFITFLKRYIQNDELVILFYKFCKENNGIINNYKTYNINKGNVVYLFDTVSYFCEKMHIKTYSSLLVDKWYTEFLPNMTNIKQYPNTYAYIKHFF